jgi:hypothetical protein
VKISWLKTTVFLFGLILSALALFADRFGLDHSQGWGALRISILAIGLLIVISTVIFSRITSKYARVYFLAGLIILGVLAVYLWFISVGYWTAWPKTTNYYDMLATSFQHGQLSLQIKPDPLLLALPNPYDIYAREAQTGITYLFDGSFYKGRFYLYWGPVPALILLPFKSFYPGEIGDQFLVFGFVSGLFIFQSLLILKIWRRFFDDLPAWVVWLGILLAGLSLPRTWVLNQPQIYEASIEGGQFFLIGGLFFAFEALDRPAASIWRLGVAGIFWSAAVGSRNVLALPVIFLTLITALWLVRFHGSGATRVLAARNLIWLLLPLAVGAGLLGWYNWARFDSPFESGLRFQLSGINYREYYNDLFSVRYLLLNLRYYFLTPFRFVHGFPWIKPITTSSWPPLSIPVPIFYYAKERVTGLLYGSPFLIFAAIALTSSISRLLPSRNNDSGSIANSEGGLLSWLSLGLLGITAVSLGTLLLYYYCTMRFIDDFIPALSLLAVLGFWQGYRFLSQRSSIRFIYAFIFVGLSVYTLTAGTLLGISSYTERFRYLNPALFDKMVGFFAR